jgi:hypothetical protein
MTTIDMIDVRRRNSRERRCIAFYLNPVRCSYVLKIRMSPERYIGDSARLEKVDGNGKIRDKLDDVAVNLKFEYESTCL